jgi:hypothetical protein
MKMILCLLAAAFSITTGTAYAADGSSGCGPGWYIFKENSLLSSALRATTNGMLFPAVTIGMTFGTSNCTRHKLVQKEKESLYFATQNHFELKTDMAKGGGEYLSAFATTVGCPAAMQSKLNLKLRSNFNQTYSPAEINPEKTVIETFKVILSDPELTQKCSLS